MPTVMNAFNDTPFLDWIIRSFALRDRVLITRRNSTISLPQTSSTVALTKMQTFLCNLLVLGLLPSLCTIAAGQLTAPFSTQDAIDVLEIQQMINLYATAADQHRFDLLPQIFTPDVTVDFNTPGVPILRGLPAVTSFMTAALRDVKSYHAQSTHYIDLTNSAAPRATTYNSATFFAGEQQRQVITRLGRFVIKPFKSVPL